MKQFSDQVSDKERTAIGYKALVQRYSLAVIPHFRWSFLITKGARRVLEDQIPHIYLYDQDYALDNPNDPFQQLAFALKHEGLNLEIIASFFSTIQHGAVQEYVSAHPSGKYERIVWYLYEKLNQKILDLPDLTQGTYIDLLDTDLYYTSTPIPYRRYRIHDNMLGTMHFCPFVRKTDTLQKIASEKLDQVARAVLHTYNIDIIQRASNYLYAQETMSSYKIEHERPSKQRIARFIELIKKAETAPSLDQDTLIQLQNSVVEERYSNTGYRITQNYIGQAHDLRYNSIHYISPKQQDVIGLMQGLFESLERMLSSKVDPMVIAAAISFGFVFIHPFDDGNGRLHRFLIHYILHKTGFTPPGIIFPVSAIILLEMRRYHQVLECFSKPLMELVTAYDVSNEGEVAVNQETASFYKYIDYTAQAEFLASCVAKTIQTDFKKELEYLVNYDKAKAEIADIVDMPDRLIHLFIAVTSQNDGKLSAGKRAAHFAVLTDAEIKQMEAVVQKLFAPN